MSAPLNATAFGGTSTMVLPDDNLHLFGSAEGIRRVRDHGVKVAIPENVDFIIITDVNGMFLTHGPVGGSNVPYQLIEWAFLNVPAFGVSIDAVNGINMPVIWLPSHKDAKRALKKMNVDLRKAQSSAAPTNSGIRA
jgi:hypothetical protein